MEITIISGAIRQERKSHQLSLYLFEQLVNKGAAVSIIDLKAYPLPVYGSAVSGEEQEVVSAISAQLKRSHAVIMVTPEYHSNISAATNNFLEYCGLELIGKVVAVATASATQFGGLHAANNLRVTLLNLGAHVCARRLLVPEIHGAFNAVNEPVKEEIAKQAEQFISGVLLYANVFAEQAPEHPPKFL